jgi:hypothetical protein
MAYQVPFIQRYPSALAGSLHPSGVSSSRYALSPLHGTGVTFYALLGLAGLAFGMLSTSLVDRLTEIVPRAFAANLSGLLATMVPLMAAIGVATFGSVYFAYTATGGAVTAIRSFALLCGLFAVTSVAAGVSSAYAMRGQRRV